LNKGFLAKVSFAETIPAVTVDVKLYGFPTAKPIRQFSQNQISKCGVWGVSLASIFSKAISIFESVPMSFALIRLFIV
jgi:hypothetical protein